jgi:hypothetical protein
MRHASSPPSSTELHIECIPGSGGSPSYCECNAGYTGFSPIVNNQIVINGTVRDISCQNFEQTLTGLRSFSLIPSVVVFFVALSKLRSIGAREMKKELTVQLGKRYASSVEAANKKAVKTATTSVSSAASSANTEHLSDRPGSDTSSDRTASNGSIASNKNGSGSPTTDASSHKKGAIEVDNDDSSSLTIGEKIHHLLVEVSYIPAAWKKSIIVKLISVSFFRAILNFLTFGGMLASGPAADPSLRTLVVVCWALGQVLFWTNNNVMIYRFMETNILSAQMKKSSAVSNSEICPYVIIKRSEYIPVCVASMRYVYIVL